VVHWPGAVVECTVIILRQTLVHLQERMHVQTHLAAATVWPSKGQSVGKGILSAAHDLSAVK
jgi:hypothetical protein